MDQILGRAEASCQKLPRQTCQTCLSKVIAGSTSGASTLTTTT